MPPRRASCRVAPPQFTGSNHVTDFVLTWIVSASGTLKTVILEDCAKIVSNKALGELGQMAGRTLTTLSLAGCASVSAEGLQIFCREAGQRLKRLTSLNLSRCAGVSDEAIRWLAKSCPELLTLQLEGQLEITDDAMYVCLPHRAVVPRPLVFFNRVSTDPSDSVSPLEGTIFRGTARCSKLLGCAPCLNSLTRVPARSCAVAVASLALMYRTAPC